MIPDDVIGELNDEIDRLRTSLRAIAKEIESEVRLQRPLELEIQRIIDAALNLKD